jgi:NHL repeat
MAVALLPHRVQRRTAWSGLSSDLSGVEAMRVLSGVLLLLGVGDCCLTPVVEVNPDAGARDAGAHDAGALDAGPQDAGPVDAGAPPDAGPPIPCSWDSDCPVLSYCRVDSSAVCPGAWPGVDPPSTATQAVCVACDPGQPCPPVVECVRQPQCLPECPSYLGCGACICQQCPPPPDAGGMVVAPDAGPAAIEVTTVAGNGQYGFLDGPSNEAEFYEPVAAAVTTRGDVLVADQSNNRIRLIDIAASSVTTFAGSYYGYGDGPRLSALFQNPTDLIRDSVGRLLVLDDAGRLRRIDAPGNVTTPGSLGTCRRGGAKLAVDPAGNVFVADPCHNQVGRLDTAGNYTVIAGDTVLGFMNGPGGDGTAEFWGPAGIALNGAGDLLVADRGNSCIRKIDPRGNVTTFSGSPALGRECVGLADGPPDVSVFCRPTGLAIDLDGNLIVADTGNNAIRRVDPGGTVTTLAGGSAPGSTDGPGGTDGIATLTGPTGVALAANGDIFVADTGNQKIRRISFH